MESQTKLLMKNQQSIEKHDQLVRSNKQHKHKITHLVFWQTSPRRASEHGLR